MKIGGSDYIVCSTEELAEIRRVIVAQSWTPVRPQDMEAIRWLGVPVVHEDHVQAIREAVEA